MSVLFWWIAILVYTDQSVGGLRQKEPTEALRRDIGNSRWLSHRPPILHVGGCINQTDVAALLELAHQRLSASSSAASAHSTSLYLQDKDDATIPALHRVATRAARLTGLPMQYFEAPSLTRYKAGQAYGLHFDSGFRMLGRQVSRTATFLVYLNTIPSGDGGETVFPFASPLDVSIKQIFLSKSLPKPGDTRPQLKDVCKKDSSGVLVPPTTGSCLIFYNHAQFPTSHDEDYPGPDRRTMHGSCPLHIGEKWIVQIWLHDQHAGDHLTGFWT